jgi:hypothetical protein
MVHDDAQVDDLVIVIEGARVAGKELFLQRRNCADAETGAGVATCEGVLRRGGAWVSVWTCGHAAAGNPHASDVVHVRRSLTLLRKKRIVGSSLKRSAVW